MTHATRARQYVKGRSKRFNVQLQFSLRAKHHLRRFSADGSYHGLTAKTMIIIGSIFSVTALVSSQIKSIETNPDGAELWIASDQFSDIETLIDKQIASGYKVSDISYNSLLRDIHVKGKLQISFKSSDSKNSFKYHAALSELSPMDLQQDLNSAGENGFHILKQTPIPIELGFLHPQNMFITIMGGNNASASLYKYVVLAYRYRSFEKRNIEMAQADGYVEVNTSQLGRINYLIMEKAIY